MSITDRSIDQAFSDLRPQCGGVRNDYFGLLYLEGEYEVPRPRAFSQVAFGGNDYGIDGFHFDRERKNFYLFQFKWSDSHAQFKGSLQRLIEAGIERVFGAATQVQNQNQLLQQIKSSLAENQALIERVCVHFIFTGDPAEAERSQVLDKLREDLENKKHIVDKYFERPVTLVVEYRSARSGRAGAASHTRKTHTYRVTIEGPLTRLGPDGQRVNLGFIRLIDLQAMYREMGQRFLERNIRAALAESEAVNRSLQQALKRIVIDEKELPEVFAFNHNGVTLFAEDFIQVDGHFKLTEPRLLNGAQTVSTLDRFLKANQDHPALDKNRSILNELFVPCKIVTDASSEFVTAVTINNNRQNPVDPANLRANDMIQLELQDKFRDDLGVYYERQENAFAALSDEDLEEQGITEYKAIKLKPLAQTFLVSDGDIDKLARLREVFEDDRIYDSVFHRNRLRADARKVVLCYKVQHRLRKLSGDIVDRGANKYAFVQRGRYLLWALLCQAMLNDPKVEEYAEEYGKSLALEAQFTDWLSRLATTRCRVLLADLVDQKPYAEKAAEGNFSFLRTNVAYKRAMELAYRRWKWVEKRLK